MKYPLLLIAIFLSSSPAWSIDHEKIVQGLEALGEYDAAYPFAYQIAQQKNTYSAWREVAAKYANSDTKGKAFLQAWRQAQALNQESIYKDFLKIRPNALLNIQAIHAIFELIKASNTMKDYVRFMKDFPDAINSVEALLKIQALAFERAKKAHDALVYDAFVTTFPGAKQIPEAIELAFQAEQQLIEKEVKEWEESFKKISNFSKKIGNSDMDDLSFDTLFELKLEGKARDLVNEAVRINNDLVAVRQYRLLGLEIFKQTVTEELRQKSSREYEQWLERQQAHIAKSMKKIKYSLIKAIQRQTQHLKSPIVDQSQKLDEVIDNYNRFVAQLAEQDKTIFFEKTLIMVYVVAPLSIKPQQQKIQNGFENPTPQQVKLFAFETKGVKINEK